MLFKRSIQDARAFRGGDVGSGDHNLHGCRKYSVKLSRVVRKQGAVTARKYELS